MKQTEGFLLQYIEGIPYLLPFGQRIAEHRRTMRLNETSAFIWKILPECSTAGSLHEKMTAKSLIGAALITAGTLVMVV